MKEALQFLRGLLRPLLLPFALLYGLVVWLRNKVYDKGIYSSIEFSLPVISIGNLSTGGTGKTPHIEYLISLLQYEFKIATMSRGYKRRSSGFQIATSEADANNIGDEPMQFHIKFPEVVVSVCEDRMTGIPELIGNFPEIEVILLDDAYQHRSVKPGLNILITDYKTPFYEDYILPFGNLREGRKRYDRADIVIVSKCPESFPIEEEKNIRECIHPFPHQKIFFSKIVYNGFIDFYTHQQSILPPNAYLILVSGIANPKPLIAHLQTKCKNIHLLSYPDHHYFANKDLEEIKQAFENWDTEFKFIVTTEKDAARLALHKSKLEEWQLPILIVPIQIAFLKNKADFDHTILNYIQKENEEQ